MEYAGYFKDKVVLITGASRGIGKAIAHAFVVQGARVIANYHNSEKEMTAFVKTAEHEPGRLEAYRADVTKGKEVERMVDDIASRYERIDILINNAGIKNDSLLALMSDEAWDRVIDVNLKSVYSVTKWGSRVMMRQRQGKIINISSLSALKGLAGQANYAASKGAVISFTRVAARELGRFGIQVNAVAPGLIETEMLYDMPGEHVQGFLNDIPLARMGRVCDVAGVVLFLASDRSGYITGQTIVVDGGLGIGA